MIVDIGLGAWGNPDFPKTLSGIVDWAKTFNAAQPIPDWVFEILEILQELEDHGSFTELTNR